MNWVEDMSKASCTKMLSHISDGSRKTWLQKMGVPTSIQVGPDHKSEKQIGGQTDIPDKDYA